MPRKARPMRWLPDRRNPLIHALTGRLTSGEYQNEELRVVIGPTVHESKVFFGEDDASRHIVRIVIEACPNRSDFWKVRMEYV